MWLSSARFLHDIHDHGVDHARVIGVAHANGIDMRTGLENNRLVLSSA